MILPWTDEHDHALSWAEDHPVASDHRPQGTFEGFDLKLSDEATRRDQRVSPHGPRLELEGLPFEAETNLPRGAVDDERGTRRQVIQSRRD